MTREDTIRVEGLMTDLCHPMQVSMGYLQAHEEARRRLQAGQRQKKCQVCGLWYWPAMMRRWGQIIGWAVSVGMAVAVASAVVWLAYAQ